MASGGREYVVRCVGCGQSSDLEMFAHRNRDRELVGWMFVCMGCREDWRGKVIDATPLKNPSVLDHQHGGDDE